MFLKCLIVMASPATIAGKYSRSRQLSFGLGTVMAMIKNTNQKGEEEFGSVIFKQDLQDYNRLQDERKVN